VENYGVALYSGIYSISIHIYWPVYIPKTGPLKVNIAYTVFLTPIGSPRALAPVLPLAISAPHFSMLSLLFCPEDRGSIFLRTIGNYLADQMTTPSLMRVF
jgi:hypothetical protein